MQWLLRILSDLADARAIEAPECGGGGAAPWTRDVKRRTQTKRSVDVGGYWITSRDKIYYQNDGHNLYFIIAMNFLCQQRIVMHKGGVK